MQISEIDHKKLMKCTRLQKTLQSGAKIKHNRNIIKTGLFVALYANCVRLGVYFPLGFTFNAGVSAFSPMQVL